MARDTVPTPSLEATTFEMSDVSFALDGKDILKGLTLKATEHRVGIIGRNGSGKTTLARLLAGLLPVSSGHLSVAGVDTAHDRKAAIQTVGLLFQNPDHQIIFPTVEEEIAFGLLQQGHSKADAAAMVVETLQDFEKQHWAKAATHQLSQGQKQLVCLMSILAMKPKVVILDEPFSGLDLPTRLQLASYFERIPSAIVHISHEPSNLSAYDRVIWLDNGQIRQDGNAQDVLNTYVSTMTAIGGDDDLSDLTD